MKKVRNFSRFYALLKGIQTPCKEDLKEVLVDRFTKGRTCSLSEMSEPEYKAMCEHLAAEFDNKPLKAKRSQVLKQMQKMGINTADWAAVDEFCTQERIAGARFSTLTLEQLESLRKKLFAIARKLRQPKPMQIPDECIIAMLRAQAGHRRPS